MMQKIFSWLLDKRVGWGGKVEKPLDKWLYNHIK